MAKSASAAASQSCLQAALEAARACLAKSSLADLRSEPCPSW